MSTKRLTRLFMVLHNQPMVFWNSYGVSLPTTRKHDSQGNSLLKRKWAVYLKVIHVQNNGRFLLLSPASFKNTPKQTALPHSALPDQFQNMLVRGTIFQKSRSLQLSIPGHSSAPSISLTSLCDWPGRSPQLCQLCCPLLQVDTQTDLQADLQTLWQTPVTWPTVILNAQLRTSCVT